MRPANESRRYIVTSSPIGWAHTRKGPCVCIDWWQVRGKKKNKNKKRTKRKKEKKTMKQGKIFKKWKRKEVLQDYMYFCVDVLNLLCKYSKCVRQWRKPTTWIQSITLHKPYDQPEKRFHVVPLENWVVQVATLWWSTWNCWQVQQYVHLSANIGANMLAFVIQ